MICPACGSEFPDEMPVCPYCQTHIPEHTPDVHAYDAYYCADTVSLRKNHWIDFFIGLLFVIALTVLAIFFQLQKPSLNTQIRRADAVMTAHAPLFSRLSGLTFLSMRKKSCGWKSKISRTRRMMPIHRRC